MKRTKYLNWFVYLMILLSIFSLPADVSAQRKKDVEKARKLAKQGDLLFNKKDYRTAITRYSEAIAVLPTFPAAYFWKGYAHYYLNEYDQSINDLNQAESQGFDKPLEIFKLRWYLNYQAKNYDAALKDALVASQLDPNNITYTLALGDIYRMKESYRDAATYYKKASEQDPNNSDVPYFLAVSYANLGEFDNQGMAALEALKRKTKYVGESNYYVADSLYKQKKIDEAAEFYQRAIEIKPDIYASYGVLSDIHRSRNEFDKAIEVTRKGLKQFPKDATLYTSLAWYYSLADRPQDAIIAAKSAIILAPDQYMAYTNLCRAYNDAKDYLQAIATCNNALQRTGDGETYLYMARAYEFMKQTAKAEESYKKAIEGLIKFTRENSEYSDGFYLLGNAYFALGNDKEAIAAYNRCLQLAPRFARARYALGYTYLINKDKPKAREQYNFLREIDAVLAEKLRAEIEKTK
jgi:tetratricopeptide (TPR) repeat protein